MGIGKWKRPDGYTHGYPHAAYMDNQKICPNCAWSSCDKWGILRCSACSRNYRVSQYGSCNIFFPRENGPPPTPPSREERIGKATEKIWHLIDRAANQSTVAKEEAHAILADLMEGKS